ncbi:MAG: hypothetical protein J6T96_04685 [Bacteroidales bacterium]|nr:hypothetical protein [Bacteroidales bacterium]
MGNEKKFWCPLDVKNPSLKEDLKEFFFKDASDDVIKQVIDKYGYDISVICDRYEFVCKLQDLQKILRKHNKRQYQRNGNILIISDSIEIDGYEFNGVPYDIDALCQYLLLTIVDKIITLPKDSGNRKFIPFVDWLFKFHEKSNYTKDELEAFGKEHYEEWGDRYNFKKIFSILSPNLKNKIINTFVLAKVDSQKINADSYEKWLNYKDEKRFTQIVKYFYDNIRCMYTHSCSRSFLSYQPIETSPISNAKGTVLLSQVKPNANNNLIAILKEVIIELMNTICISKIDNLDCQKDI